MKKVAFLTLFVLGLAACETKLDLSEVSGRTRLVVNGLINDQDKVEIQVSKSIPLGSNGAIEFINNAVVTVRDENGNSTGFSYNVGTDKYENPTFKAIAGRYYSVSVKAPGFDEVFAEMVMPEKASKTPSSWKDSTDVDTSGYPTGTLTVNINDKGITNNYYRVSLFYYDNITATWNTLKPVTKDATLENEAIVSDNGSWVFSDRSFNGQQRSIPFITPFGYALSTPKYLVVTESLSEQYFKYFKSIEDYKAGAGVFGEATPIFSNIRNGVGIWAGSSIVRDTIQ
ncbi:MAG: DUF4249 domain-containing protein [Bacteroidetes bacterium]|jgi:Domain of unknown function (DUF4249)|nr:DUF4249 domain-containing protein [Bacteroidota bacterium]